MSRFFPPRRNFSSLSVKDLLEAREAYHVHLTHLQNVIGTAIGRYRIRLNDPDTDSPDDWRSRKRAPARTFSNTVVRKWSWPCVLVIVREWLTQEDFFKQDPDQSVPRCLYMPDGRMIPTCVICAEQQKDAPPPLQNLNFPAELIGGGYPVVTEVQNQQHIGSLGCLVTDGDATYALTNRHVTGVRRVEEQTGRDIFTILRGEKQRIGETDVNQVGKKLFGDIYPGWPGERSYSTIDAGLIRIDDLNYWTAQVFGIGELDDPVDLNVDTISLDLIGCPLLAFGGASGKLVGEIKALFYRYKSIGGFDYVSDLLIGERPPKPSAKRNKPPVRTPLNTHPGDSGTLWFFDDELSPDEAREKGKAGVRARRRRPVALQWGGQILSDANDTKMQFALATCLSTICRQLDVDVIPDWQTGHSEYWGKVGHYKIGAKACELPANQKLRKLLMANVEIIAFGDTAIEQGSLEKIDDKFIPLADVPDLVWRATRKKDEANHFADMDEKGKADFKGKTLLQLCEDPKNVDIDVWNRFYDSIGTDFKRGALPFRTWQIYKQMVESVSHGEIEEFICAAGVLAHYVGDACQPLHVSRLHHGSSEAESDVHSVYETRMLDRFAVEIINGVNENLKSKTAKATIKGGKGAAIAVIDLMRETIQKLPPATIIKAFNDVDGGAQRTKHMFDVLGARTEVSIANGCLCLANIWGSAWREGQGNKIAATKLTAVDPKAIKKLYDTKSFVESFRLQDPSFKAALA